MKRLFLILMLMTSLNVFAQDAMSVVSGLQEIKTYTADFVQYTEIEGFGEDRYSGKLYIVSGENALWDYDKPYRQFYLFDRKTMQYYDSDTRQLLIQNLDPATNVFMRLMLSPADIAVDFDMELVGDDLLMKPKADLGVESITFTVRDGIVRGIKTRDQNGNNTRIELTDITTNKPVDKKVFKPEIPEGTEVFRYN